MVTGTPKPRVQKKPRDPLEVVLDTRFARYDMSLALRLDRISQILDAQMENLVGVHTGLDYIEWRIMAAMSFIGAAKFSYIVNATGFDKSVCSRALSGLEAAKMIKKLPTPGDGRSVTMELTDLGKKVIDDFVPVWRARQERLLVKLTKADRLSLFRLLDKLTNIVQNNNESEMQIVEEARKRAIEREARV